MSPDFEFRCYVTDKKIRAISQYHCYMRLEDGHPLFDPTFAANIADRLVEFHDQRFAPLIKLRNYVVDIAIDPTTLMASIVEVNPHGPDMSSGSALYSWSRDLDLLQGHVNRSRPPIRIL